MGKDREAIMVTQNALYSSKSTILVSAACFNTETLVLDDFKSVLFDPEYVHAERNVMNKQRGDLHGEEAVAYMHQIRNLWRRKCSVPFVMKLSILSRMYISHEHGLLYGINWACHYLFLEIVLTHWKISYAKSVRKL